MPNRRDFLNSVAAVSMIGAVKTYAGTGEQTTFEIDDRQYWLDVLKRLSTPVLGNLAQRKLRERMPIECVPGSEADRRTVTHLEAFGRLLSGIAPWLELADDTLPEETKFRMQTAALARQAMDSATDPQSPDFLNFTKNTQPLVDAAFLSLAILRAPNELWKKLDGKTQANLVAALKSTRVILPHFSNWLLFSATIEAALCSIGQEWDKMRIDYAVRQHDQWYKGDGMYGDGPEFHWDYYNSFVIHPLLIEVLQAVRKVSPGSYEDIYKKVLQRAQRYAEIQERLISPEGTYPAAGRSITYRCGAFHLLAQSAFRRELPKTIKPAQVRSALSAVIRKTLEAPGTFDADGWLTIGLCGHQPALGENYISTGSLYLCANALLPLGLSPSDEFWSAPPAEWTAKKLWSGQNLKADHAL